MTTSLNTTQRYYTTNGKVVAVNSDSLAAAMQQSLVNEYTQAREQYKQSHARYSGREAVAAPSRFDQFCTNAFQDMFFYTCATDPATCCAPSQCPHGAHKSGLHEINYALRRSARERLRAAPLKPHRTASDVFALLVTQEAAELGELLALEANDFEQLAHTYYDNVYGPRDRLVWQEAQARRALEDAHSHATVTLLAEMRSQLWQAEQRLLLRALNVCPDVLPHQSHLRSIAARAAAELEAESACSTTALDSREAVPLWHRVCVIRGETESEEDIAFRRLLFACTVEAHCLEEAYVCRDAATGCLRCTAKPLPYYMQDAIDYTFKFEQFALVMKEESRRMELMEAAEQDLASLFVGQADKFSTVDNN